MRVGKVGTWTDKAEIDKAELEKRMQEDLSDYYVDSGIGHRIAGSE